MILFTVCSWLCKLGEHQDCNTQECTCHCHIEEKIYCCELFKIEFEHGSFSREVRDNKVYWWIYLYDDKNRELDSTIPNVSPIEFCPHCGNNLQ